MEMSKNNHEQDREARHDYCTPELKEVSYGELLAVEGATCQDANYQQTGEGGCAPIEMTPEYEP